MWISQRYSWFLGSSAISFVFGLCCWIGSASNSFGQASQYPDSAYIAFTPNMSLGRGGLYMPTIPGPSGQSFFKWNGAGPGGVGGSLYFPLTRTGVGAWTGGVWQWGFAGSSVAYYMADNTFTYRYLTIDLERVAPGWLQATFGGAVGGVCYFAEMGQLSDGGSAARSLYTVPMPPDTVHYNSTLADTCLVYLPDDVQSTTQPATQPTTSPADTQPSSQPFADVIKNTKEHFLENFKASKLLVNLVADVKGITPFDDAAKLAAGLSSVLSWQPDFNVALTGTLGKEGQTIDVNTWFQDGFFWLYLFRAWWEGVLGREFMKILFQAGMVFIGIRMTIKFVGSFRG